MRWVRFEQDNEAVWGHLDGETITVHSGSPWTPCRHQAPERLTLDAATLLPPCQPTKIICVGRNYAAHAKELGHEVPRGAEGELPLLFFKPPSAVLAPGGAIVLPPVSKQVDYEGELAVIVGRRCARLGAEESPAPYIAGYTCLNDVTARDLQNIDKQWTRAKGFDTFCPLGPWMETEPQPGPRPWDGLTVETRVNGELRQQGNTRDFIFSLERIFGAITAVMTLEPGDVIATGTPPGVGHLAPGDRVEVSITGIGTLASTVTT